MDFLMQQIGPFPLIVWAGIVVGGALLAWWLSRRLGGQSRTPSAPAENPNIDSSTGLPYTVENATDPNTGLPVYTLYNPPPQPINNQPPIGGCPTGQAWMPSPDGTWHCAPLGLSSGPPSTGGPLGTPCGNNGIWIAGPNGTTICSSTMTGPPQSGPPIVFPPTIPDGYAQPWGRYQTAYGASWPEPNHTLYDVWQDHGAGIPWADWEGAVRRANPQVGKSGRLLPNERVRIP